MLDNLLIHLPILFDGAMGTRLQALGLPAGHPPDEWNLSHPAKVLRVHREYVEAGSQIIQTNTFGANRIRLDRYGLTEHIREINLEGVRLAREAAGKAVLVAASLGPTGEFMEPYGDMKPEQVLTCYRQQVELLRDMGIELFHLETFSYSGECLLACQAISEAGGKSIPSFTYEPRKDGSFSTLLGESPAVIGNLFRDVDCVALGVNCGTGMKEMIQIIRRLRKIYPGRLSCRPNAGTPQIRGEETIFPETAEDFYQGAGELIAESVAIIGGCCGTDDRFIRNMKKAIEEYQTL